MLSCGSPPTDQLYLRARPSGMCHSHLIMTHHGSFSAALRLGYHPIVRLVTFPVRSPSHIFQFRLGDGHRHNLSPHAPRSRDPSRGGEAPGLQPAGRQLLPRRIPRDELLQPNGNSVIMSHFPSSHSLSRSMQDVSHSKLCLGPRSFVPFPYDIVPLMYPIRIL